MYSLIFNGKYNKRNVGLILSCVSYDRFIELGLDRALVEILSRHPHVTASDVVQAYGMRFVGVVLDRMGSEFVLTELEKRRRIMPLTCVKSVIDGANITKNAGGLKEKKTLNKRVKGFGSSRYVWQMK